MQHLLIGVYILTFVIGFISVYHLTIKYNIHKIPFLKTYKHHILAFNLVVFALAVTRYYKVNIMNTVQGVGSIKMQHVADELFLFQKGIEYFGIILIAYTLVKMLYQIQQKPLGSLLRYGLIFVLALSAFAYGIGMTQFLNGEAQWIDFFCDIISGLVFIPVIGIFAFSLIKMKKTMTHRVKFPLSLFMIFYLIVLLMLFSQNFLSFRLQNLFVAAIILAANLFPLFCSRMFLRTQNIFSMNINNVNLERLVSEYNISGREREILVCILQGLSNKEIKDRLFLSPHTVKNHNYNLYRKLGVGNRGELLRKTWEYQNNQ